MPADDCQSAISANYYRDGFAAFQDGRRVEALDLFARAAVDDPRSASCAGVTCQALGRLEEAETWHRRAAASSPGDPFVLNNFGVCLVARGRYAEAAAVLQLAREADQTDGEILTNLTGALNHLGRHEEAVQVGNEAVRHAAGLAQAHNNLGNALLGVGDASAARKRFEEALRLDPGLGMARVGLGNALCREGQPIEGIRVYREALRLQQGDVGVRCRLAEALLASELLAEGLSEAQEAVRVAPRDALARTTLGNALVRTRNLEAAAGQFSEALLLRPGWSVAGYNLALTRQHQGRVEEARLGFRAALAANPTDAMAHSTYVGSLFYDPAATAAILLAEHRDWAARHAKVTPFVSHANAPDPDRPLRVGYVSPDFRAHATAFFVRPILAHHDPRQFEVVCYSEVTAPDERTAELRTLVRHWCDTPGQSDTALAERIRADGIDVLVDLGGHLAGGRVRALAHHRAPVQISYLGYPGTTGVPAIDFRLTDSIADPPGAEVGYSEELVRQPGCFCCYEPPPAFPIDPTPPSRTSGILTFGSLHKLEKLNPEVLDLWCELLRDVPRSQLLLARDCLHGPTADFWRAEFVRRGIAPERVHVEAPKAVALGHLHLYGRIDIALDPFPWGGHTTACEALWMGVPTITLLGERYAGRMVASVLRAVGLGELVAETPQQYRSIAIALADNEGRRSALRTSLRGRMLSSPLCDGKAFTRGLEDTYRQLWRRWCQRQQQSSSTPAQLEAVCH